SRFFFSSRRRHTRSKRDWSSDVCSSDLPEVYRTRGRLSTNATRVSLRAKAMIPLFEDDEIEFWAKQNSSPGINCKGYSNVNNNYAFGNIYRYTTLSEGE